MVRCKDLVLIPANTPKTPVCIHSFLKFPPKVGEFHEFGILQNLVKDKILNKHESYTACLIFFYLSKQVKVEVKAKPRLAGRVAL